MTPAHPPLQFGILSTARIAQQFCVAVAHSPAVNVVAVGSRSLGSAQAFAQACDLPVAHASYEALLSDERVQAVYIPLPNSMHVQWAIKAAQAGKHVLCEKPLALNRDEAQQMLAAAQQHGVILLEAFPWLFQPQTAQLVQQLQAGAIGAVRSVQANFGFHLANTATDIRMQRALGGGALLDAGCYPLSLIRLVMGQAPQRVQASAQFADGVATGDAQGVDMSLMATLEYADGRRAQLSCAMDGAYHRQAIIVGTEGVLETGYPNHGNPGQTSVMRLHKGRGGDTQLIEAWGHAHAGDGFRFCAEAFARLVHAQDHAAMLQAAQFSLDNAYTLEAIERSARSGQAVLL